MLPVISEICTIMEKKDGEYHVSIVVKAIIEDMKLNDADLNMR